jgi:hypothetical protein
MNGGDHRPMRRWLGRVNNARTTSTQQLAHGGAADRQRTNTTERTNQQASRRSTGKTSCSSTIVDGQFDDDASSRLAGKRCDTAVVILDDLANDGETQAGPAIVAVPGVVDSGETLEDADSVFERDAGAIIDDR